MIARLHLATPLGRRSRLVPELCLLAALTLSAPLVSAHVKTDVQKWPWSYPSAEALDAFYTNWLNSDPTIGAGAYRLAASDGSATISVTKIASDTSRTRYLAQANWSAQDTLAGGVLDLRISLSGEISNPTGAVTPDAWVASMEVSAHTGDRLDGLAPLPGKTFYATHAARSATESVRFIARGRYLVVDVVVGNPMLKYGTRYIYDAQGTLDTRPKNERILATLVRGSASLQHQQGPTPGKEDLSPGETTEFQVGDRITTGPETRVSVLFPDGSTFTIKSNSTITLMDGGLQLQLGETGFNLQKQGKQLNVVTPTAVAGVADLADPHNPYGNMRALSVPTPTGVASPPGTSFEVTVTEDPATSLRVTEGRVRVTHLPRGLPRGFTQGPADPKRLTLGREVELAAGESATVTLAGFVAPIATPGEVADSTGRLPGTWQETGNRLVSQSQATISVVGNTVSVTGSFVYEGVRCVWHGSGTLHGREVEHTVIYTARPSLPGWDKADGRCVLTLSEDGRTLSGQWYNNNGDSGPKAYTRGADSPKANPPGGAASPAPRPPPATAPTPPTPPNPTPPGTTARVWRLKRVDQTTEDGSPVAAWEEMFRNYVKQDPLYGGNHSWGAGDRAMHVSHSRFRWQTNIVMVNRIDVGFDRPGVIVPGQPVRIPLRVAATLSNFAPEQNRDAFIGSLNASVWATADGTTWSPVGGVIGGGVLYPTLNERELSRQLEFTLPTDSTLKTVVVKLICGLPSVGGIGVGIVYERDP